MHVPSVKYSAGATRVGVAGGMVSDLAASLARAERAVTQRLVKILEQETCSAAAWRVLCLLADSDRHPMAEVAQAAALPGPSLTRLIDRLAEDNLVYRLADERDRRRVLVCATERGLSLQRLLGERVERESGAILAGASRRDAERLVSLLSRLD